MKKLFTLALLLLATTTAMAKSLTELVSAPITFSQRDFADTIRITLANGGIIVPVEIAGQTRHLMFDTGAPLGVWLGGKEDWMLPIDSMTVGDVNGTRRQQVVYQCPSIRLGSLVIGNYPMVEGDAFTMVSCGKFDGLLGFNLVGRGLSFKIDTRDSLLIVTDRKGFFADEERHGPTMKFKMIDKSRPMIDVELPFVYWEMVFDTGALNTCVALSQEQLDAWLDNAPKKRKEVDAVTVLTDTTLNTAIGMHGMTMDTLVERILHFPSVKMGSLTVNDLYLSTANKGSRVGAAILQETSLIIDAHKRRLVFLPHDGRREISIGNKETGSLRFIPAAEGDTLGVLKAIVRKGSSAYEQGIRTGDYLTEANGVPITDVCTYIWMEKKDTEADLKFRSPEGVLKKFQKNKY